MARLYVVITLLFLCSATFADQVVSKNSDEISYSIREAKELLRRVNIDFVDIGVLLNSSDDTFMPLNEYENTGEMESARKLENMGIVSISIYQEIRGLVGPFVTVRPTKLGEEIIMILRKD
jgi:hypothetical protein